MEYKTIANRAQASFIIKKSEFIGVIAPVQTDEQAVSLINETRANHRKANHNCYAYILRANNISRYSDDGEPGGTAGVPIHEVLTKSGLFDIVCVVTRYFGGIHLGAGGLIRAYSNSASTAIDTAKIKIMALAFALDIQINYSLYGIIGNLLNNPDFDVRVEKEQFSEKVDIRLYIRKNVADKFIAALIDITNANAVINKTAELFYNFSSEPDVVPKSRF